MSGEAGRRRQSPGVTRLPTRRRRCSSLVGTASFRLELAGSVSVSGRRGTDRVVRHRSGQILVGQARPGGAGAVRYGTACVTVFVAAQVEFASVHVVFANSGRSDIGCK